MPSGQPWTRACALLAVGLATPLGAQPTTIDDCVALVRERPDEDASYRCFSWLAYLGAAGRLEIADHLEALAGSDNPGADWARAYHAFLDPRFDRDARLAIFRESAEAFQQRGVPAGAACAWLFTALTVDAPEEQIEALQRAGELVRQAGDDRVLQVHIDGSLGRAWLRRQEVGRAGVALRRALHRGLDDLPPWVATSTLMAHGRYLYATGRYEDAEIAFARAFELLDDSADRVSALSAAIGVVDAVAAQAATGRIESSALEARVRRLLQWAARSPMLLTAAHCTVARYLPRPDALRGIEQCLAEAPRQHFDQLAFQAYGGLVEILDPGDVDAARRARDFFDRSIAEAQRRGRRSDLVHALRSRAALALRTAPRAEAVREAFELLEVLEQVRSLEPDTDARVRTFARHSDFYYHFADWLIGPQRTPDRGDLERAFLVTERMRARTLLDELDAADAALGSDPADPDVRRRDEVLAEIAALQRELAGIAKDTVPRELDRLARLEDEERMLRMAIAERDPRIANLQQPDFPALDQLQQSLSPDELLVDLSDPRAS